MQDTVRFSLTISRTEYLRYYRGQASSVIVRCDDGRTVQFPASLLRDFVTADGVSGEFSLNFDERRKAIRLTRIS